MIYLFNEYGEYMNPTKAYNYDDYCERIQYVLNINE